MAATDGRVVFKWEWRCVVDLMMNRSTSSRQTLAAVVVDGRGDGSDDEDYDDGDWLVD